MIKKQKKERASTVNIKNTGLDQRRDSRYSKAETIMVRSEIEGINPMLSVDQMTENQKY